MSISDLIRFPTDIDRIGLHPLSKLATERHVGNRVLESFRSHYRVLPLPSGWQASWVDSFWIGIIMDSLLIFDPGAIGRD